MTKTQATADVFLLAYRALPKRERDAVLAGIAANRRDREDLIDIAIVESRRGESSRPLRDVLADARRKK